MKSSDLPAPGSLRKELQGPRPAPSKLRKDSHKIRKTQLGRQIRPQAPVIIYIASPKVIHTNPSDFMNLVQRLTGSTSLSNEDNAAISPAARFAAIEKTKSPPGKMQQIIQENFELDIKMNPGVERSNLFPGILSPEPTSLPPVPSSFFSLPPSDPNSIGFFHDLSPVYGDFIEGSFMPSPSSYFIPSPITPSVDLFNNFFSL